MRGYAEFLLQFPDFILLFPPLEPGAAEGNQGTGVTEYLAEYTAVMATPGIIAAMFQGIMGGYSLTLIGFGSGGGIPGLPLTDGFPLFLFLFFSPYPGHTIPLSLL